MNAPDALIDIASRLRAGDALDEAARLVTADALDDLARRSQPRGKIALRRQTLRVIKNVLFVDRSTTDAAREIAARWQAYIPTRISSPPGTVEHYLARMHREGIRPREYRTILTDLQATAR